MAEESTVVASVACASPDLAVSADALATRTHSFRDILKSSAIIGGSSAVNILIGMVRTKAMALMLGPQGYGLMGALVVVMDLTRSVAQLGINASGVRQIAEAVTTGDKEKIALTVAVLRRTSLACALLGASLLVCFAEPVSILTFGDNHQAHGIALLSIAIFFSLISGGQGALLQGMRRIGDMAKLGILGALLGTLIGVPMVYVLGVEGLVPTLVVVAACSLAASWWYASRIKVPVPTLTFSEFTQESASLLKLGLAFMASGLLTTGAAYAVRIIVLRHDGLEAAGIYGAAWTLGGLYIGFVLQALGTDFYPRLVGAVRDDEECNRLVNEQALVSLLLAVPGVILTLTLAPLVISLFYSAKFTPAVEVLRWICLGMALRVLTWPLGFVIVAQNRQAIYFAAELAWTVVNVALTWWCVRLFGVNGAGIAFFGSYIFHVAMIYPIVRRLSGFRWTRRNRQTASSCIVVVAAVFVGFLVLPPSVATGLGLVAGLASGYASLRILVELVSPERLPGPIARLLQWKGAHS